MGRLEGKHWAVIVGFLAATSAVIVGLDHWSDLATPKVAGGLMGQIAALLGAIFVGAPKNPATTEWNHPSRREDDQAEGTRARTIGGLLAILLLPAAMAGCGGKANPNTVPRSQVAQVAVEATAVLKAADAVLTALDGAMEPTANPRLPTSIGLPIVKAIREVGVQGQNLKATLTIVKSSANQAEQAAGAERARQTLQSIRQLLTSALSPIRDAATKDQVSQLLAGLVEALDKAQQIVDAVRTPIPLPHLAAG